MMTMMMMIIMMTMEAVTEMMIQRRQSDVSDNSGGKLHVLHKIRRNWCDDGVGEDGSNYCRKEDIRIRNCCRYWTQSGGKMRLREMKK